MYMQVEEAVQLITRWVWFQDHTTHQKLVDARMETYVYHKSPSKYRQVRRVCQA